ncbi:MAG: DUF2811 domain-containing protein [Leptolyngbya sp. SIO1D8]|nr:DUF2811 domain-containing protein [Leptolyngbya sp. SIO1D8]
MNVSLIAEIPEPLAEQLQAYLDTHPGWSQQRAFSAAISLFLLQSGNSDRQVSRTYLDTLFDFAA